ncbi:MAG: hypothetical protein ABIQ44_05895 [Chloroflexia bacterium]
MAHLIILSFAFYVAVWLYSDPKIKPFTCFVGPMVLFSVFLAEWISATGLLRPSGENWFWTLVSVGGFVLAAMHLIVYPYITETPGSASPTAIAFFGGVVGAAQSIVLQRHVSAASWVIRNKQISISSAYLWIPANIAGAVAGVFAAIAVNSYFLPLCNSATTDPASSCGNMTLLLAFVVGLALFSIITGTVLVWLLNRSTARNPFYARPSDTSTPMILALAEGALIIYTVFLRK